MILGVDHISLSCEDIEQGLKVLGDLGYRPKFVQKQIDNHSFKKPFLKLYKRFHSVAYCQHVNSVALELTQHSSGLVDKISPYQLFFNKHPAAAAPFPGDLPSSWEIVWRDTLGCQQFMVGYWPELHAQFWYEAQSENTSTPIIRAALMPVFDMGASKEFWTKALGFSLVGTGNLEDGMNWAHITFRSFVRSWSLDIILLQNESSFTSYLDDPGFPCLALITNHIMRDREEALRFGAYNVSDSFELRIGENLLNIVLLRGPSNELVELIQLKQIQR